MLLHTLNKDRGANAQRSRILEQAKLRIEFWKTRVEIQAKTLSEEKFAVAKEEANQAIEDVRLDADKNLMILSQSQSPTPVIGLPTWRKLRLLYKPMEGSRMYGYFGRALYLSTSARAADRQALFHSKQVRADLITLGIYLAIIIVEATLLFKAARRDEPFQRIKEIDRI